MKNIHALIAAIVLLSILLLINLFQTLTLLVRPFSQPAFRRLNRWSANTWWGLCASWAEKVRGIKVVVSGAELPMRENSIVILNHQSMADIPVVFFIAKAKGRLGDLKWFVKDVLKYAPGVGWGMLFLDCLFIKRDWLADQGHIHRVFKKILDHSVPLWLMIFAEGTRLTKGKLLMSRAYAEKQGLEPFRHVLHPRTKGFVASVQSLRGHIDAIYDLTIGYANTPTLWQWMRGEVRTVHLHVRRFPVEKLPTEDPGLSQWLLDLFREKDVLLDGFYEKGLFGSPLLCKEGMKGR